MACGNENRTFYPPLGIYSDTTQQLRDYPYIYDINVNILNYSLLVTIRKTNIINFTFCFLG